MIEQSSLSTSRIRDKLGKLDERCYQLVTTVFSTEEAEKYIDEFRVDVEKLKEQGIEVTNNPFLLSCFRDTKLAADSDVERFRTGIKRYMDRICHLTERFLCIFSDPVHKSVSSFSNCLAYLEVARHGATLTDDLLQEYQNSYLALEYLTELEKNAADGTAYTIKLLFPKMYDIIVQKLKESFKKQKSVVLAQPVVRGYIFGNLLFTVQRLTFINHICGGIKCELTHTHISYFNSCCYSTISTYS